MLRIRLRALVPTLAVVAIIGLSFLAPARGGITGVLASLSYSYSGPLTSGPSGVKGTTSTEMGVFILGAGFHTFFINFDGTSFSGATDLDGTATADPGAVFNPTLSQIDLFVRGTDSYIYHRVISGSNGPWTLFGGRTAANTGPDPIVQGQLTEDIFVDGTDRQLYHRSAPDGVTWGAWQALGGTLTSEPGAVSWALGRIDVFVRGTDNQMYHRWYVAPNWFGYEALGGILTSAPAAASCQSGHIDVFVRGTDNALYRKSWNGASWSAWSRLGGSWSSSPSAVCRPTTNLIDVFARDFNANLVRAFEVTAA